MVEAFNKNIINKLEYILLDDNNSFGLTLSLNKAAWIYNNTDAYKNKNRANKSNKVKRWKINRASY